MTAKKSVRDVDVRGKKVFVRVDFNVPMDAARVITDDTRIRAALPTIRYLLAHGAVVILASHLGRPKTGQEASLRLAPTARRLADLLGQPVEMASDSVGPDVVQAIDRLTPGNIILLENLRFHREEEANDQAFARQLAGLADIYVNDAFGAAHRAHASTEGIAAFLPAVAGFLMEAELEALGSVLRAPARPLAAIIGGAKISSKIGVLDHLLSVADEFLIGGGMANTFFQARGMSIGRSLVEADKVETAAAFLRKAVETKKSVHLPSDVVVAESVSPDARYHTVAVGAVPDDWSIVDIGQDTVADFTRVVKTAGTVVWNGPMGIFEIAPFAHGTQAMALALAHTRARTIVGGGDSVAAVEQVGVAEQIDHISTGGGASLEYLEGRVLPGVEALQDKD